MRLALHAALRGAHIIFLDSEQKTVVHKIKSPHELNILFDLLLDLSDILWIKFDHVNLILLIPLLDLLKIDVLEGTGVLQSLGLDDLSVDH